MRAVTKPRHLFDRVYASRFAARFGDRIVDASPDACERHRRSVRDVLDTPPAKRTQNLWGPLMSQRHCLAEFVERYAREHDWSDEDTWAMVSDLDEVPPGLPLLHVKHCETRRVAGTSAMRNRVVFSLFFMPHHLRATDVDCERPESRLARGDTFVPFQVAPLAAYKAARQDAAKPLFPRAPSFNIKDDSVLWLPGGVHMTGVGTSFQNDYKGFNHAEGGGMPSFVVTDADYCSVRAAELCQREHVYINDKRLIARYWDANNKPPMRHMPPPVHPTRLADECHIPWPLVYNVRRYASHHGINTYMRERDVDAAIDVYMRERLAAPRATRD